MLIKKALETYSTKERADLLLSDLEKLKERVSSIETRYGVLQTDFSRMCEEAIAKLSEIKSELAEDSSTELSVDANSIMVEGLNVLEPEISNLKARFKLGILPVDLKVKHQDILVDMVKPEYAETGPVQTAVDRTAEGIELVLDKLGDGLIFPIVVIVNAYKALIKLIKRL
jgi:hypothetical protein